MTTEYKEYVILKVRPEIKAWLAYRDQLKELYGPKEKGSKFQGRIDER